MRVTTLISAAFALISTVSAASDTYVQYTVSCPTTYVVKNGDTCSIIGKAFNIYTSKIKEWNPSINSKCTNLYIDQILCLSEPTTHTSVVHVGESGTLAPTRTPAVAATATATPTVLTMPNAGHQCEKDSDCAGLRCCDLSSHTCVLDPYGKVCDKKATISLTKSSAKNPAKTTTTTAKHTTVAHAPTETTSATHKLFARGCVSGSKGKKNGDGYKGYCCSSQADCWDDCVNGVCNGSAAPHSSTTSRRSSTTSRRSSTTTSHRAASTSSSSSSCTSGAYNLGNGNGYNGACCASQADCLDDCISGVCNGPTAPGSSATTTSRGSSATTTAPHSSTTSSCTSGAYKLGNGNGYNGACCASQADCLDDCISGVCNGPTAPGSSATTTAPHSSTTSSSSLPTGLTVQISSSADFCFFLPPTPGNAANNGGKQDTDAIADSEKTAVAFCTRPNVNAPGAGVFPEGFILSASYQTDTAAGFKQIRGTINPAVYKLSSQDQGGQYDNHGKGSPPKSACAGYPYYVNLVEPSTNDFCIRCCESYQDCNAGRSAYGCNRVVPAL